MSNPYESPQYVGQAIEVDPGDRERLRRVARRQQWVIYTLLAQIGIYGLFFLLIAAGFEGFAELVSYLSLLVAVFGMVTVFMLAKDVLHIAVAVICAFLMVVPCISLLVLLVANGRATRLLQQHGIKVGLMGANPELI